jgi:hypothetical protein
MQAPEIPLPALVSLPLIEATRPTMLVAFPANSEFQRLGPHPLQSVCAILRFADIVAGKIQLLVSMAPGA